MSDERKLYVVDSADTGAPKLDIPMSDADGKPSAATQVSAIEVDEAAKSMTVLGASQALFLKQGQLHAVDLRRTAAPAARRVSALADGCAIDQVDAIDAAGNEAWVSVTTAGADGRCDAGADNQRRMVRTGMTEADAPKAWPADTTRHEALRAPGGDLLGFAVLTAATLNLHDATLAKLGAVASAGSVPTFEAVAARTGEQVKYLRIGLNLHRLDYTASSATLSAPLLSFSVVPTGDYAVSAWDQAYVVAGRQIYSLGTAATPMALVGNAGQAGGEVEALELTDGYLVSELKESGGAVSWWSVRLDTRQIRPLAVPAGAQLPGLTPTLLGSRGDTVYAQRWVGTDESDLTEELISVPADGSAGSVLRSGVVYAGPVLETTASGHTLPLHGLLYCTPVTGRSDCAMAPLQQWSLPGASELSLGLSGSPGGEYALFGYGFAGRPFAITAMRGMAMDMLVATGDAADSLVPMSAFTRDAGGR